MPLPADLPAAEAAIVQMTNAFRGSQKLAPVRQNPKLVAAARAYAKKLAGYEGLSHTADGTTPAQRVASVGYRYCIVSENLASILDTRGFTYDSYARRAVTGWENSPGHRHNMLLPHVTETGVGVVQASPTVPKYIAVQLFGRPESEKYSFKVRNLSPRAIAYRFDGEDNTVSPREIITHTVCQPGVIAFDSQGKSPAGRYETRSGQVYSLRSTAGGVAVEVGDGKSRD
ncbi:MAG: CAP domain-containing protein [Hyphomicrobium sp.]|jgi:hypothetical protein